ncbi:uncharacterized protein [Dermacentor albipictus]|uniref:uncharacterized protein n=1 Tax=Dermacentor albipictus TaxID=60249 RepID=UPI0038FC90C7
MRSTVLSGFIVLIVCSAAYSEGSWLTQARTARAAMFPQSHGMMQPDVMPLSGSGGFHGGDSGMSFGRSTGFTGGSAPAPHGMMGDHTMGSMGSMGSMGRMPTGGLPGMDGDAPLPHGQPSSSHFLG